MKNAKTLIKSQCRNTHQALMCFLCFFFFFAGMHQVVHAVPDVAMKIDQDVHITGIVQDTNKEPMIGVSVMVLRMERSPILMETIACRCRDLKVY